MKRGGGKAKGAAFEREVCKALSLWVTNGRRKDCFWRSAMSGGRATIAPGREVRQCGDITAVAFDGYEFARKWFVECKHVKHLAFEAFFIKSLGTLHKFWRKAIKEAARHRRDPMIIARQNGWPDLVITRPNHLAHWVQPFLLGRNNGMEVDVSFFSDLLRVSYDGSNHSRPTINRQSKGRVSSHVHEEVTSARPKLRPRNHIRRPNRGKGSASRRSR